MAINRPLEIRTVKVRFVSSCWFYEWTLIKAALCINLLQDGLNMIGRSMPVIVKPEPRLWMATAPVTARILLDGFPTEVFGVLSGSLLIII
jgi:hypothetical protein